MFVATAWSCNERKAKPITMKPRLQIVPGWYQQSDRKGIDHRTFVNESAERDARLREGIAFSDRVKEIPPAMFASYGNGPFLMPSLQYPC